MKPVTRRSLLGLAGVAVVSAAGFGHFAFDGEFEEHLADVLGVPLDTAKALAREARANLGETHYDAVAAGFTLSTTVPGKWLLPRRVRERSVHSLLSEAIHDSRGNLVMLGLRDGRTSEACGGLLPA